MITRQCQCSIALALVIVLALSILGTPLAAEAQQVQKTSKIGVLLPSTPTASRQNVKAFKEVLRELGRVEGKNCVYVAAGGLMSYGPSVAASATPASAECASVL